MDYNELAKDALKSAKTIKSVFGRLEFYAAAITDLLARAEAAEAANNQLEGTVTTLMESNRKLSEELKAHTETDLAKAHEALSADWSKQKQRAEAAEARAEKAETLLGLSKGFVSLHEEIAHWRERAEKSEAELKRYVNGPNY